MVNLAVSPTVICMTPSSQPRKSSAILYLACHKSPINNQNHDLALIQLETGDEEALPLMTFPTPIVTLKAPRDLGAVVVSNLNRCIRFPNYINDGVIAFGLGCLTAFPCIPS